MFGEQAVRLLRKDWPDATQLAQELYAMFQDDIPLTQTGPLTLSPRRGVPALTIKTPDPMQPLILVTTPDGEPLGGINLGDVSLGDTPFYPTPIGDLNAPDTTVIDPARTTIYMGGKVKNTKPVSNPDKPPTDQQPAGGAACAGNVLSGAGATYQVALYENGLGVGSTGTVQVTVAGLAAGEDLAVGTWLTVCKSKLNTYAAVAAVWG
jgi:hypothetical protein